MLEGKKSQHTLIPHLFRQEYAKMTAVLCRHFSLKHIEIAEDIASDTFLKASEYWAIHGVPKNPTAWLYTVAKNKTRDYYKHRAVFEQKICNTLPPLEEDLEPNFEFTNKHISDSQLAMIFAVCNPENSKESQICLALQILCGFSINEIAHAFLTKKETIKKRLQRARTLLRNSNFQLKTLTKEEIKFRLDTVLKTIYILFNEGYFSKTNNQSIRKDLCLEAVRLTHILVENTLTNCPKSNALLALLCFQSSRLQARIDTKGSTVLFDEQDENLWDKELIKRGQFYLIQACQGNTLSTYHLEASIAYWHTIPTNDNKWVNILKLYDQLLKIEYSPIIALNRLFVFSKVNGIKKGIHETEKLNLITNSYYHQLLGFLKSNTNKTQALKHYKEAILLSQSLPEKKTLQKAIDRLNLNQSL